ncbi:MAG: glutamate--tRNA ligase family protein [Flavobacteriales bacterium]
MRTRIAPTPSGFLHAGNGVAFVLAHELARQEEGSLLLRIDDLDQERVRTDHVEDIFRTLEWLGITWDEGPRNGMDLASTWSQQHRLDEYHELLNELRATGNLYACTCSRKDLMDRTGSTEYDGHCRNRGLDPDTPGISWRLRLPAGGKVDMKTWPSGETEKLTLDQGDPVLLQRNGRPAYHIASLVDDLRFQMDTIVRGTDLLASTAVQLHIAELLGLSAFHAVRFLHHPLLPDGNGAKLSKSGGSASLRHKRENGQTPEAIHVLAAQFLARFLAGTP